MAELASHEPAKDETRIVSSAAPSMTSPDGGDPDGGDPDENSPTWGGFLLFLAERVFLYFALYTLSIGPFYWSWYGSRFVGGSSIIAAFYQPLIILADWVPRFGDWIDWYVRFWII